MTTTLRPPASDERVVLRRLREVARTPSGAVDLDVLAAVLAPCDLLETADVPGTSYLVVHDGPVLRDDGERSRLWGAGPPEDRGTDPFAALDGLCAQLGLDPHAAPDAGLPRLCGGLVGAFGYDLARRIERLPTLARADRGGDHLVLRVAELIVAVEAARDEVLVLGRDLTGRGGLARRVDTLVARVRSSRHHPGLAPAPRPAAQPVHTTLPAPAYTAAVTRILGHLAAGESFQVNLSQRLTARWPADTAALYRALRAQSPAAHGALLPSIGVASVSPETFLEVEHGRVVTRPIKGTRPRASDPELDAALADDLATAAKDRAENVMIVDLLRNDLGRVCRPGTVRADELAVLEAHPTVWHLVSRIHGQLEPGTGFGELLRATFPCGSVTGAPKVRSMAIIEALEPVRRGWYCGAIGFLAPGAARLSVAIRTAVLQPDGRVDYAAGGGVVADSDPDAEHAESLDKAAAFLRAVGARQVVA